MASSNFMKSKLEFRDLVLTHWQKILNLSCVEFKGGYNKKVYTGNIITEEYVPDTRSAFIEAVISFSDMLLPYLNNNSKFKKNYKKYISFLDLSVPTFTKEYPKLFKNNYNLYYSKDSKTYLYDEADNILRELKLKYARKLFRVLSLLLNKNDYLKTAIYGEGVDEVVEGDFDTDEEEDE